jgi:hypothetical protein
LTSPKVGVKVPGTVRAKKGEKRARLPGGPALTTPAKKLLIVGAVVSRGFRRGALSTGGAG